jgi:hypothetical protein
MVDRREDIGDEPLLIVEVALQVGMGDPRLSEHAPVSSNGEADRDLRAFHEFVRAWGRLEASLKAVPEFMQGVCRFRPGAGRKGETRKNRGRNDSKSEGIASSAGPRAARHPKIALRRARLSGGHSVFES